VMVLSSIRQPMNQPWISVEGQDNGLVHCKSTTTLPNGPCAPLLCDGRTTFSQGLTQAENGRL
jgi:hypothetical protein